MTIGILMTACDDGRRLERRWTYARRRLLELPQKRFGIEVDFCPLPDVVGDGCGYWLGLVVDHLDRSMPARCVLDEVPNVNDLAYMVTVTMRSSRHRGPSRPEVVFLRDNPEWEAMYPFLENLKIEVRITEDLRFWDARAAELIDWLQSKWATWPKTPLKWEKTLAVSKNLYDLRRLAYWFTFLVDDESR